VSAHSDRLLLEKELDVTVVPARATATAAAPPAAARADAAAMARALDHDYPGLVALLVRRVGDRQLAQDLLHDAIVTALDKLESGTPVPPDVLAGFVFRTAMNHLRNHRRHQRVQGEDGTPSESLVDETRRGPADQAEQSGMRELVRRVLQHLSSHRDRELLVRFYLDEEDKMQICESFALSGAQFDRVIFRARDRLRALLERTGCSHADLLGLALLVVAFVLER
jgi:RNA polymerase sigma-70 factor (ECF subfamily)